MHAVLGVATDEHVDQVVERGDRYEVDDDNGDLGEEKGMAHQLATSG